MIQEKKAVFFDIDGTLINSLPAYHKLLITTDGGMLLSPTLEQKKDIIINAVGALRAIGYTMPKVCVLAAA